MIKPITSLNPGVIAVAVFVSACEPSVEAAAQIDAEFRTDMNKCNALVGTARGYCAKRAAMEYRERHNGANPPDL
ncbi:MAG: hypothetical protein R3E77_06700 [Steroidobacteraceae bacterium]